MSSHSKVAQEAKEQAAFQLQLQGDQLEHFRKELADATEELENWRSGNIRLSNAKAWREGKASGKLQSLPGKLGTGSSTDGSPRGLRQPVASPGGSSMSASFGPGVGPTASQPRTPPSALGRTPPPRTPPQEKPAAQFGLAVSGAPPPAPGGDESVVALRARRGGQGVEPVVEEE